MQKVQEINSTKTGSGKKGRPPALNEEEQLFVEQVIRGYSREGRSTVSDEHISLRLADEKNIKISAETIRRIRVRMGIRACPRGGARPGAGRPRKTGKKQKIYKKLRIGDYALVTAARSVYECEPPIWDEKSGTWIKPEKWRVRKDAEGKKMANLPSITFLPGMPFGFGGGKRTRGGGRSDKNEVYKKIMK